MKWIWFQFHCWENGHSRSASTAQRDRERRSVCVCVFCVCVSSRMYVMCKRTWRIKYDIFYNLITFCRNQSSRPGRPWQSPQGWKQLEWKVSSLKHAWTLLYFLSLSLCIYIKTNIYIRLFVQVELAVVMWFQVVVFFPLSHCFHILFPLFLLLF